MNTDRIDILLIDDDQDDYIITRDLLEEIDSTRYRLEWAGDYRDGLHRMRDNRHDVYLLDYRLGEGTGLDLLREAAAAGCDAPIILLTGQGDREVDLLAMEAGAADFLAKDQLNAPLLERAVRYALERWRNERELAQMAQYDLLTGLPNRFLLQDRLRQAVNLARRDGRRVGLMFLDLDRFKAVNDTFGHATGDLLLKSVAEKLKNCVRDCDTLARLGGDEFVVVAPGLEDGGTVAAIAERIVAALQAPVVVDGEAIGTGTSIGIALFPEDGDDSEALMVAADTAMYRAKEAGGGGYRFICQDVNRRTRQRLTMEGALRRALSRGEFLLHYQPQLDLQSGGLAGVEALLRWDAPDRGLLYPPDFLPVLEETGLMVEVGEWVAKTAVTQFRRWAQAGIAPGRISMNLSGCQLIREDLRTMLKTVLAGASLPPPYLELELTEAAALAGHEHCLEILAELKSLGVRLAIDDFGSGCSSLTCLRYLPVDRVKIDPSFIRGLGRNRRDESLVRGIVELAHGLGVAVVAEGVETAEQAAFLREVGCDEGQGFWFGKPSTAESGTGWGTPGRLPGSFRKGGAQGPSGADL